MSLVWGFKEASFTWGLTEAPLSIACPFVTVDTIMRSNTGGSVEIKSRANFVVGVELFTANSPMVVGTSPQLTKGNSSLRQKL